MEIKKYSLTTTDLISTTGYSKKQIRNILAWGLITPDTKSDGTGHFNYFGLMQALAMVFIGSWAEKGFSRKTAEPLFDFVLNHSEEELLEAFAEGRTHVLPVESSNGFALVEWKQPQTCNVFDLKKHYVEVKKSLERLAKQLGGKCGPVNSDPRGRRRGLAESARK